MDTQTLRTLIRDAQAGQTLILAPDVYDTLAASAGYGPDAMDIASSRGIQIQRNHAMKPGTAMIMSEAHFAPPPGWASRFLAKSGPVPFGVVVDHNMAGPAAPPKPPPAPPAPPKPPPKPPTAPPTRVRQRIVDT